MIYRIWRQRRVPSPGLRWYHLVLLSLLVTYTFIASLSVVLLSSDDGAGDTSIFFIEHENERMIDSFFFPFALWPAEEVTEEDYQVPRFRPAHRRRIIDQLKGKRYLVLQVDNRIDSIQNNALSDSIFGPSIISMSRWAKENNYAYLLYIPPQNATDPGAPDKILSPLWHKVPGMILATRLAKEAKMSAVLFIDSDVSPGYLPIFDTDETYPLGKDCSSRWTPLLTRNASEALFTLEQFLVTVRKNLHVRFESSPYDMLLTPAHKFSQFFMNSLLGYPHKLPFINSGALLIRPTNKALKRLRYWYLETPHQTSTMEVSRARGILFIRNIPNEQEFKAKIEKPIRQGSIHFDHQQNGLHYLQDIYDPSVCTPLFEVSQYSKSNQTAILFFSCRGSNATLLYKFWNEICQPNRLIEIFNLSSALPEAIGECSTPPIVRNYLNRWPGDQARLQDMVFQHPNEFYIQRKPPLAAPQSQKINTLLHHWSGDEDKLEISRKLDRYLMEQTFRNSCFLNKDEWQKYGVDEIRSVSTFRLRKRLRHLPFKTKEKLIFGETCPDFMCSIGKYLEVMNM